MAALTGRTSLPASCGPTSVSRRKACISEPGCISPSHSVLQKFRAAIDAGKSGRELAKIVSSIQRKGYVVGTHDTLNSAPRGYTMQHPRIDLLRMKDIYAGRTIEPGATLASRKAVAAVKKVMADVQPLGDWLAKYLPKA